MSRPARARPPRRGRRPGGSDTRAGILASAREQFAAQGFSGTTIRAIAAGAGVDAALVHHYFGSKDDLFLAALDVPVDPRELMAPVVAQGAEGAAERMLRAFLGVWDDPELRLPLLGVVRAALEPSGHHLIRDGFLTVVLTPIGRGLGLEEPERRMTLVASQVIGLILVRYVIEMEPVASMPVDQVVATYAPTIQRYLTGALP